jgi:hypothetical protein
MNRHLIITFVIFALYTPFCFAAKLTDVSVEKKDDRYILHIETVIKADSNRVKKIITDYNNLTTINPALRESNIVSIDNDRTTVNMLTHTCVLFICYTIRHFQAFQFIDNNTVYARIIPESSDFKYGWVRWFFKDDKIDSNEMLTELTFDAELTPDFFILPIIGTYQLKKKLLEIASATIRNLEIKAQNSF